MPRAYATVVPLISSRTNAHVRRPLRAPRARVQPRATDTIRESVAGTDTGAALSANEHRAPARGLARLQAMELAHERARVALGEGGHDVIAVDVRVLEQLAAVR